MFNQIWGCYRYALKFDRTLLIDTASATFTDDFFSYFAPHTPFIQPFSVIRDQIDSLRVHPHYPAGHGSNYKIIYIHAGTGFVQKIDSAKNPDGIAGLDFSQPYDEDVIVHQAFGGGPHAADAFRLFTPSQALINEFKRRRKLLPDRYCALHIRNTDLHSNYMSFVQNQLADLAGFPAVFLTSDNQATIREIQQEFSPPLRFHSFSTHISNDGAPIHSGRQSGHQEINFDAISDLLLLAASARIFSPITTNGWGLSGFTRLAQSLQNEHFLHAGPGLQHKVPNRFIHASRITETGQAHDNMLH